VLNYKNASNPLYLLPVGVVYFALYYWIFTYFILRFDLKTPGREPLEVLAADAAAASQVSDDTPAARFVTALGGRANLQTVDACTTRLRLAVADSNAIDEAALKRLGARGVLGLGKNSLRVVLGPIVDQVGGDIREHLSLTKDDAPNVAAGDAVAGSTNEARPADVSQADRVLAAIGGADNLRAAEGANGRLLLSIVDPDRLDAAALATIGRGVAFPLAGSIHVLIPGDTRPLAARILALAAAP